MQVQSLDFWKKHFFRKFVIPRYKLCTMVKVVRHKTRGKISLAVQTLAVWNMFKVRNFEKKLLSFFIDFYPLVSINLLVSNLNLVGIYKVQHKFENLSHCSKFSNLASIKNKNVWWRLWKKVNFQSKLPPENTWRQVFQRMSTQGSEYLNSFSKLIWEW